MKKILTIIKCLLPILIFLLITGGNLALGQVRIASVSGSWSNTTTWGGQSVPVNTDDITINSGVTVTMDVNGTCRTITDMAGGSISGAGVLTIAGSAGIAISDISGTATISCPVSMPAVASISISGSLAISGAITGAATNLIKNGTGVLILLGSNSYVGITTVSAGILNIRSNMATGNPAGGVIVSSGARLEVQGGIMVIGESLSLAGEGGGIPEGALFNVSNSNMWAGPIVIDGALTRINCASGDLVLFTTIDLKNNSLVFQGAANTFIAGDIFSTIGSGDITKEGSGNLSFGNQAITINSLSINEGKLISTSANLNMAGDFSNNAIFDPNTGTVNLSSSVVQSINGTQQTTFNNLTLNNSSGAILGNSEKIDGTLTLLNGTLTLGTNNLTLGIAPVAGSPSVSNMIVADGTGECRRIFTSDGSYMFPLGDNTGTPEYSPVTLNVTSGSYSSAYVAVRVTDAKHPDNSSAVDFLSRYWTVSQSGITSFSYDIAGTFLNADIEGNINNIITGAWIGSGPWQNFSPVSATSISASGITGEADFTGISTTSSALTVTIDANPALTVCKNTPVTLTANPTGDSPFSYVWLPDGQTTAAITPSTVTPGSILYTVIVTDGNGQMESKMVTVKVNDIPVATTSQINVKCKGDNTGTATAVASGGTAPYTYSWNTTPVQNTATATGLIAGIYSVTITDANLCSITKQVTITEPAAALSATTSQINVKCKGGNTGTATAVASGGTATYNYSWNTTPVQNTATATGLIAGTFSVTITDANLCSITKSVTITEPAVTLSATTSQINVKCKGGNTGTATAVASGGTATYNYSWNTTPVQNTATATGLIAGTYSVTITDANLCSITKSVTITEPAVALSATTSQVNVKCKGDNTGTATAVASGGTATYNYSWNTTPVQNTAIATGLIAGTYSVTITDANLCSITKSVTITEPAVALSVISTPTSQTICSGNAPSIALSCNVSGATFTWTVVSSNVTGATNGSGTQIAQILTATGNSAGTATYTITPSDNGCLGNPIDVIITVYGELAGGSIGTDQIICNNTKPAAFTNEGSPSGGTALTYLWQQKVGAGSWTSISGATGLAFAVLSNLTQTTQYRRSTISGAGCGTAYSNEITVAVYPSLTAGTIGAAQTICYNTIPAGLSEITTATGGTGSYTYQWQSSPNNSIWTNISGATSGSFDPDALLTTMYYRRIVTSESCGFAATPAVLITVRPNITAPVASGNRTICYNTVPLALTATTAFGGTGTFIYQWQSSPDNSVWTDIATATNYTSYAPPALTNTTYYRLQSTSTGTPSCGIRYSNVITVSVLPELTSPVASADQTICYNSAPLQLTSSPATGGNNTFSYQWYSSLNNSTWSFISSATGSTYQPVALIASTYYHIVATATGTPGCGSKTSNSVLITIYSNLTAGTIGTVQSICYNSTPVPLTGILPANGGNGTYTYQWQSSLTGGAPWADIPGADSESYSPGQLTTTVWYRRAVTSGSCGTVYSSSIKLTVYPILTTGIIGNNQSICYNGIAATISQLSSSAGGTGAYTYQWQSSVDNISWDDISGAISSTYSPGNLTSTLWFRRSETSGSCGMVFSNSIKITVYDMVVGGSIGSDQTICYNTKPIAFTNEISPSGGTGLSCQWQQKVGAGSWTAISGATGLTYTVVSNLTQTTLYRRSTLTLSGCGTVYSNVITVTVYPNLIAGNIGTSQTICSNAIPASLTELVAASGGSGFYTYHWESSPTGAAPWTDISGATSETYVPGQLTTSSWFRRGVTSGGCGTVFSTGIKITVYTDLTAGTIGSNQTICYNSVASTLSQLSAPTGGNGIYSYLWQSSADNLSWDDISGATSGSYSPGNLTETLWFRRIVTSGSCGTEMSNSIKIAVYDMMIGGSIGTDQNICYNTKPVAFTNEDSPSGGTGLTYQWQQKVGAGLWTPISGATGLTYTVATNLTQTTSYRRGSVSGSGCGTVYSNVIIVTVQPSLNAGTIGAAQTICYNTIPAGLVELNAASGGGGGYTYQWQSSPDNSTWTNIAGAISGTYSPGALSDNMYYRRIVTSADCGSANTPGVLIAVRPDLTAPVTSGDRTICFNTIPASLTATAASGGSGTFSYQWQYSPDNSVWNNIAGATNYSYYTPTALTDTRYYRIVSTSTGTPVCGSIISNVLTITVLPDMTSPVASTDQTICYSTAPLQLSSTTPSGGNGTFVYQWYSSINNVSWTYLSGATGLTYLPASLTTSTYFHVIATATGTPACGSKTSNSVLISVNSNITAGVIGAAQTICYNAIPAALTEVTAATGGTGSFSYQWQSSTDNSTWIDIPGATSSSYTPAALSANNYFRRTVTSANCGSANTPAILITVRPDLTAPIASGDRIVCYNTIPVSLTSTAASGGSGTFNYQWQSSTDNSIWTNITGATNYSSYTPAALISNRYYQLVAISTGTPACGTITSNILTVTVLPDLSSTVVSADQTICYNGTPMQLTSTDASGGNETFIYQWYSSLNNVSWTYLSGETGLIFQPPSLTLSTYYHVIATATGTPACGSKTSNSVLISVYPNLTAGSLSGSQSVCYNTAPSPITGILAVTGGTGTYNYQWQSSSTGVAPWTDITGATSVNYSPGPLTSTIWYRRAVTSGSCGTVYSAGIQITVFPDFLAGSIGSDQTICYNTSPVIFTQTLPSGGNGVYSYQWQSSTDNISWSAIPGATLSTYFPGNLTTTLWFRRSVVSGSCGAILSNSIKITVYNVLSGGSIGSNQAICYNTKPVALTNEGNPSGGTTLTYQWQQKTGAGLWTAISGATGLLFAEISNLTQTTYYRRMTTSGSVCGSVYSNEITVTVYPNAIATATPVSPLICSGTATSIALTSSVSGTSFSWTASVVPAGSITGALSGTGNTIAQVLNNTSLAQATVTYTITPSANSCSGSPVNVIATVNPVAVLSSPLTASVCSNTLFNYSPASNTPLTTFNWTREAVLGIQNVTASGSGVVNETLVNTTGTAKTVIYEFALTTYGCTLNQNVVVTVNPMPALISSLSPPAFCSNTPFAYNAISSVTPGTTFAWTRAAIAGISNPAGSGSGNINETLINTSSVDVIVPYVYTLSVGSCTNDFTVNGVVKPTPTVNLPANSEFCVGEIVPAIVFTGSVSGTAFTWGNNNTAIGLGTNGTGNIASFTATNTTSALLTATISVNPGANSCNGTNSTFTISVYPSSQGGIVGANTSVCGGSNSGTLALSGYTGIITKWQSSTDGGTTWVDISNTTSLQSYTNIIITTQYRAEVQSGVCASVYSSIATITVNQPSVGGTVTSDATVCSGANNGTLILSGSTGTITKWQSSINGGISWSDINNTSNAQTYTNLTVSTQYLAVVQNGSCPSTTSSVAILIVNPASVGGIVSGSGTVCSGTNSTLLTLSGYTGSITKWQSSAVSDFSSGVTDINDVTAGLTVANIVSTTYFRAVVSSGVCSSAYSTYATITVNPLPAAIAGGSQSICLTGTATVSGAAASNGTILWTENGAGSITAGATTLMPTYTPVAADAGTLVLLTMTVTSNNTCAPKTATAIYTITVNSLPTASAGGSQTICSNGTATVSGASASNGTIIWTENGAGTITAGSNTLTPTYTADAADAGTVVTLTMTVTSNNACVSQTATATYSVTVNPLPTAVAGGSQTICSTGTATVSGASATNGTILWTENGAGSITSGASTLTPVYTAATADAGTTVTLTMTVTSSNSCSPQTAMATYEVSVIPASVGGSVSGSTAICSGTNSTILTLSGYTGSITKWQSSTVAGFSSGVTDIVNTSASYTVTNLNSTTYYRAVIQNGTCSASNSTIATITVNPTPVLVITNPTPVCAPGTVNLTLAAVTAGSTLGLAYTYWTDAAGTISFPTPATAGDDIYFIKGTTLAGCSDIKPVTASVYATLDIPVFVLGASSSICKGSGPMTFSASVANAITLTYSLDAASLLAGNTINPATGFVTFAIGYTGTSQITATATGCGSPSTAIHSVTVNPAPTVTLAASPSTAICEGSGVTLTATNLGGNLLETYSGATASNINLSIANNNRAAYTYSTINLAAGASILSSTDVVMVTLNVTHKNDGDLDIFLVDPSGTRAMLISSDNGGNGNNYASTVFRTDAGNIIGSVGNDAAPFTGTYRPEGTIVTAPNRNNAANNGAGDYTAVIPANALDGAPIDGLWSLRVFDDNDGNSSAGSIVNWSLSIIKQTGGAYTSVVNGPQTIGAVTYSGTNNSIATSIVTPPAGSNIYTVTTTATNGCAATSNAVTVVVNPLPTPTISADYCTYRPKVRLTTGTYSSYLWNTGATTQSIDVDIAGKYTVAVTSNGCTGTATIQVADELVTNGDFSAGNTGFVTPGCPQCYKYIADDPANPSELNPEGWYGVGPDAHTYHTNFWGPGRGGAGNFMIINGFPGTPQPVVWQQTITGLTVGTTYYFAAWARSLNSAGNGANLKFSINSVQIGTPTGALANVNSGGPYTWTRFYGNWTANSTTAILEIVDLTFALGGNDFGIDDISFGTLASVPFTFTASNNSPKCSRESVQLSSTVTGGVQPIVYNWTGPNGYTSHDANPIIPGISYNDRGTYSLSVVDAYNCPVTPVNTIVTLNPTPEIFNRTALICSGSSFNSTPVNGVPNASTFVPSGTTYSWSAPTIVPAGAVTGASAQTAQASISQILTNTTNLPATVTYTVTPVNGGCTGNSFTVTVTVNPSVTVAAGVDQQKCAGSSVQLNGSVSGAVTSGSWSGGTGAFAPNRNALNAVYTPSAAEITAGTITLTLNSVDPDGAGPCPAVSSSVTITINSLPALSSTSENVSCFGTSTGSVNLSVTGGTPAYNYLWTASGGGIIPSGSGNVQDISGLVAGTYTVVVTDTKTCGATLSVALTQPTVLEAHESHTTVPCVIGATNVTITAAGGTAPYTGTGIFAQFAGIVTYTVTDVKGCTSTVNATVIADPNSAPVIITCPVTRNFNGCTIAAISGPAFSTSTTASTYAEFSNTNNKGVANDNCAITSVTYQDIANSGCPVIVTRTWTLGDAIGLTTTCQQIISVTDVNSPTWISVAGSLNRLVECSDAAGLAAAQALFPVATDVCDADVSNIIKSSGSFVQSAGCSQEGTYTNTWLVADACGNISAAYTQVITITDNTAPVWLTAAGTLNRTAECSDNVAILAAQALYPSALDLCDASVTDVVKVAGSFVAGTCGNRGTYTNTWTASDDCGNVSTVFSQVITITDNTAPDWLTAPGALDRTLECSNTAGILSAQALVPISSDNCTAVLSSITKITGLFVPSAGCLNEGKYTNTWTVADACGNTSAIYTQVLTIQDNVAPYVYCPASDAYSCDSPSLEPTVTGTATVIDNCDVSPVVSWSDVIVNGACAGNYQISRTWSATDACGNTNTCLQTIFVQDVAAPVITCAVTGNQNVYPNPAADYIAPDNTWDATATDNCSGVTLSAMLSGATATGPHTSLSGVAFSEGVTIVIWTATDGCGISSTCQFTVTVTFKPVISCPAAITRNNDTDVCSSYIDPGFPTWIVGTAPVNYTWVMSGATTGSGTGPIGNYTFNSGITTIAWTAANSAGTGICEQTITVNDNQAPAFNVPADKYYCVQDISVANFDDPTIDITPLRPDYYLFASGITDLDLDPATFSDNCPATCIYEIRWRVDFEDGTFLPALPATYITGQPSVYGNAIMFPGSATSSVPHFITYQIVDCNGNVSAPKKLKITIDPRPDIIKIN